MISKKNYIKIWSQITIPLKLCGNIDGKRKRLMDMSMAGVESVTVLIIRNIKKCQ